MSYPPLEWKPQPTHPTTVWFAFRDNKPIAKTTFYFASQKWLTQVQGRKNAILYFSLDEAKAAVDRYFSTREA